MIRRGHARRTEPTQLFRGRLPSSYSPTVVALESLSGNGSRIDSVSLVMNTGSEALVAESVPNLILL